MDTAPASPPDPAASGSWEDHIISCIRHNSRLQTWAGHLDIRIPELHQLVDLAGLQRVDRMLEVGCGNALGSAFLSPFAREIWATDLPDVDHKAHAIGLSRAEEMVKATGTGNIQLKGCSADALPFGDRHFDVVFSLYVLEHLPDQVKSIAEMARVLKDDGRMIALVPGFGWSLAYPFEYYPWLLGRVLSLIQERWLLPPDPDTAQPETARSSGQGGKENRRRRLPNFPFPEPHGEYPTWFAELAAHRASAWVHRCRAGGFSRVRVLPLMVLPRGIFHVWGRRPGKALFRLLAPLDRALTATAAGRVLGQFYCLICEK